MEESMPLALSLLYQLGATAAFLFLAAVGLIIILGMMNIINLAHGELMMMGAYVATITTHAGLPFPIAVIVSFFVVAAFGAVLELLIVRRFYGRELGALVVTWGISLVLGQGTLLFFGPFMPSIKIPGGSFSYGVFSFSEYSLILMLACLLLILALWLIYSRTTYGLQARATMQNAEMAKSLGVPTGRIYTLTFSFGAGLAGLSGALLAPTATIAPFMGQQFVAPAFITVVVGGATSVIGGAVGSSLLLAAVKTPIGMAFGAFSGSVALLVAALFIIRIMPNGISAQLQKFFDRRAQSKQR
jgi:branched-subunit amino acid ABC-type transport system permease component